jgi:hypothetical protein
VSHHCLTQVVLRSEATNLRERGELRDALTKRLSTLQSVTDTTDRAARFQTKMEGQVGEVQEMNSVLMSQLSEFLDRFYPDNALSANPSQSQALSQVRHPGTRLSLVFTLINTALQDEGRGLKELLQDLMNRSVTKADDPWLHLTPQVARTAPPPSPNPTCATELQPQARGATSASWHRRQGSIRWPAAQAGGLLPVSQGPCAQQAWA